MAVSDAAWLRALDDNNSGSSSNRSWKRSDVVVSSGGAIYVSCRSQGEEKTPDSGTDEVIIFIYFEVVLMKLLSYATRMNGHARYIGNKSVWPKSDLNYFLVDIR